MTAFCRNKSFPQQGASERSARGTYDREKYADAVISLDADLQDDVDAIEKMVDNFIAGDDIVYGVRSSRKKIHSSNASPQRDSINSWRQWALR